MRKLHKRLLQLGAAEIYPRGEADEQHEEGFVQPATGPNVWCANSGFSLDGSFVPWTTDLRSKLLNRFALPEGVEPVPDDVLLPPKWILSTKGDLNGQESAKGTKVGEASHDANRLTVTLEMNKRMTPLDHWQDVRHLDFVGQSTSVSYDPGDVLTIYPENSTSDVQQLIDRMRWHEVADVFVSLQPTKSSHLSASEIPPIRALIHPITFRELLTKHLDLNAIPRRSFFSLLAHFTTDSFHKDRLIEFTKPEYLDELYDYTTRPRRSILEVLQEFDSVKIPWQWAANVLPELRGRQFSIASGGHLKKDDDNVRFELLVAIVKYKTVIKKIREGVCTRYLAGLKPGSQINVSLQRGGLGVTQAEAWRPVVLVGPGTGVAPMRSLIWERLQWSEALKGTIDHRQNGNAGHSTLVGNTILVYGSRNQAADFFYQDEWRSIRDKMLFSVHTAFSRDQSSKIYVQDVIHQQGAEIARLVLSEGAIVYVCGSSGKMPAAVRGALTGVFEQYGGLTQGDAETYLARMEKEGRYKQETWD